MKGQFNGFDANKDSLMKYCDQLWILSLKVVGSRSVFAIMNGANGYSQLLELSIDFGCLGHVDQHFLA